MTTKNITKALAFLTLALPLLLMGCEGDQGPAGPQGPPGQDASVFDFTYVGEFGVDCIHCHSNTVDQVMVTGHTHAYTGLDAEDQENPYCLQCHTTGWDRHVDFGSDEWMTAVNPDENGYDDYFGVEGDEAAARREVLEGVQCESCHGPMGPDFNDHAPLISFATIATHDPENITTDDFVSLCYPCHHTQFEGPEGDLQGGYATSGHANGEGGDAEALGDHFGRSSCDYCHTSEGFIRTFDPAYATYDFGGDYSFIGCVTCHDPHAGAEGQGYAAQVRTTQDQAVQYVGPGFDTEDPPSMTGYGVGQLCAQCHHARRDNDNVDGQIAEGSGHFGPHHSAQMDMYIGYGSYEVPGVDFTDDRTHSHQSIAKACVNCHMVRETLLHGELQDHAFHNFRPEIGTQCSGCHPGIEETYLTDYQATVEGLMDDLASRFGFADYHLMVADAEEGGWDSEDPSVEVWQREAAYALFFTYDDGSLGVHNPSYVEALLNNAIAYYDANDTK